MNTLSNEKNKWSSVLRWTGGFVSMVAAEVLAQAISFGLGFN
ncbi:hypothetical protein [Streptomyces chilikensis]|uniref:Uncharacterized protein n=1 Tax=Streptomyces chilikensis TaxID=1194079 RepID=A0ABV3ERN0_9ACTN